MKAFSRGSGKRISPFFLYLCVQHRMSHAAAAVERNFMRTVCLPACLAACLTLSYCIVCMNTSAALPFLSPTPSFSCIQLNQSI